MKFRIWKSFIVFLFITTFLVIIDFAKKTDLKLYTEQSEYVTYSDDVKDRIRRALEGKDEGIYPIKPFIRLKSIYKIVPEYRLAMCEIEKAMSTLLVSIYCYLFDTENFVKANRKIEKEWWPSRFCANRNELSRTEDIHRYLPDKHDTLYMVREPIERFISGFVNKCIDEAITISPRICYSCMGDLECVLHKLRQELVDISTGKISVKGKPSYAARHFAPLTWYCDLMDRFEEYTFIRYASKGEGKVEMTKTIATIFENHGVPQYKIDVIKETILGKNGTRHSTQGSEKVVQLAETLQGNPEYMTILMDLYGADYDIFGLQRPV